KNSSHFCKRPTLFAHLPIGRFDWNPEEAAGEVVRSSKNLTRLAPTALSLAPARCFLIVFAERKVRNAKHEFTYQAFFGNSGGPYAPVRRDLPRRPSNYKCRNRVALLGKDLVD